MTSLNKLAKEIWDINETKGFHDPVPRELAERTVRLALIMSECAEAIEDLRTGDHKHHQEEVADIIIRVLHYGFSIGIDLDAEVLSKLDKNRKRPPMHGKLF